MKQNVLCGDAKEPTDPATPAPTPAGSCSRTRFTDTEHRPFDGQVQNPAIAGNLKGLARAKALARNAADPLSQWKLGKFIQKNWHPIPSKGMKPIPERLSAAVRALGISPVQADAALKLHIELDKALIKTFGESGFSVSVIDAILSVIDMADTARYQGDEFDGEEPVQCSEQTVKRSKPPSRENVLQTGRSAVELAGETHALAQELCKVLDNAVVWMDQFLAGKVQIPIEQRVAVNAVLLDDFRAVYSVRAIVCVFIEHVSPRALGFGPQIEVKLSDQPSPHEIHAVWDDLICCRNFILRVPPPFCRGPSAAAIGIDLRSPVFRFVEHLNKLRHQMDWAECLQDEGKRLPAAAVRKQVFQAVYALCRDLVDVPGRIDRALKTITQKQGKVNDLTETKAKGTLS